MIALLGVFGPLAGTGPIGTRKVDREILMVPFLLTSPFPDFDLHSFFLRPLHPMTCEKELCQHVPQWAAAQVGRPVFSYPTVTFSTLNSLGEMKGLQDSEVCTSGRGRWWLIWVPVPPNIIISNLDVINTKIAFEGPSKAPGSAKAYLWERELPKQISTIAEGGGNYKIGL